MLERIRDELQRAHPADLAAIRQYVAWMRSRRYGYEPFTPYLRAHWVKAPAHWV